MRDEVNLYVICAAESFARGQAKAFSLSRVVEGEGARPFSIFVVRTESDQYFGYVNSCPHQRAWLNIGEGKFFSDDGKHLRCGRHKAEFEIESGVCVKGKCKDKSLEPVAVVEVDGEICICGVELAEEERSAFDDYDDDTMEIMISPD
jgi:nitrite reductase/ring-hydroxylating ferredoxin subunit